MSESSAESFLRVSARRIRDLLTHPRRITVALLLAGSNWLLDAAALWIMVASFGQRLDLGVLLTVYAVGNLLPLLPLTPGGLGIVEGAMVSALVGFGTVASAALFDVIGWRLLEFWLPIPLAAICNLSLRSACCEAIRSLCAMRMPTRALGVRRRMFARLV